MAITVTSNLTLVNAADATTNWALAGSASAPSLDTDIKREGTGSINTKLSAARGGMTITVTSFDFTNGAVYFWITTSSNMSDTANTGGITIRLSDGTNFSEWQVTLGSAYPGGWQRYCVQDGVTPNTTSGTLTKTAVTSITIQTDITSTIKGSIKNVWFDRIDLLDRHTDSTKTALKVIGSVTTTGALWTEIKSNATNDPTGIVLQGTGVLMCNGPIQLGDDGTGSDTLTSQNEIVVFQKQAVLDGFFELRFKGNSTGTNTHEWGAVTGSGSSAIGSKGTTVVTASSKWKFSAADTNINNFNFYGCTFTGNTTLEFGSTSTKLAGSGKNVNIVDNTIRSPSQVIKNLDTAATINIKGNKVSFASNATASLNLYDAADMKDSYFSLVGNSADGGRGFVNTSSTLTNNIFNYNFNNITTPYITIGAEAEVWNAINPTWSITDQTQLDFLGTAQGEVDEKYELTGVVQEPSGTAVVGAETFLFEASPTPAIPTANRIESVSGGAASSNVLRKLYTAATASSALTVVTHSTFAWKVYDYGFLPFVSALTIDSAIAPTAIMLDDTFQSNGSASSARTLGDTTHTVAIEQQTNSATLLKYTGGSGTLSVGNTVANSSNGATGVVAEILEGNSTAGTVLLNSRNGTAWPTGAHTLNNGGGGWTGTYTASSVVNFKWLINASTLTMQQLYDYLNAKLAENPLDTSTPSYMDTVIIWGRAEQGIPIQGSGSKFKTVRNVTQTEGWAIYNTDLAGVDFYTGNDGTLFTPQALITITVTGVTLNAQIYIATSGGTVLLNTAATTADGSFYKASVGYAWSGSVDIVFRARQLGYLPFESTQTIGSATDTTVTAVWLLDPNIRVRVSSISATFANANPDTITRNDGGSFVLDGWAYPGYVTVSGSASNNNKFQLSSSVAVTTSVLTLDAAETLTAEGPATGVTLTFSRT